MKWDSAGLVEQLVWNMRLADLPRGENREIVQSLFNGDPPFDESTAEDNNVEINRNTLEGPDLLSGAREKWNNAFLPAGNYISVTFDSGDVTKREAAGYVVTRALNKQLKKSRTYLESQRTVGGNAILHGPGPVNWPDRKSPIPIGLPVASLMIPSETDINFEENLEHFAVFRELTPSKLYTMTHGPRVDPGWNMPLVKAQLKYTAEKLQKEPNATAYQYMPERIEELIKQDLGFWGSDAVPTIDIWDFYFKEGCNWYRRIILDWGLDANTMNSYKDKKGSPPPKREGWENIKWDDPDNKFLYTSKKRVYARDVSQILHCQFADCSCYFPAKYHSQRSLGWMLWGICDLQNRLDCKFNEQVFMQLMWFFQVASDAELKRLKTANFKHLGIIPPGIKWITAQERFKPDAAFVEQAFGRNLARMQKFSSSQSPDMLKQETDESATTTMAKINAMTARVGGMLNLAYTYEEFKDREICRRFCIPHNSHPMAKAFRTEVLNDPAQIGEEFLDVERWIIKRERVLGAGDRTAQMAIVQGIQNIRKNLTPDAQREADHLYVLALTQREDVAEKLASTRKQEAISDSMNDAQLSTDRLLRGLPFHVPQGAIPEDYVKVWIADLILLVQKAQQNGNMATVEELVGFQNMAANIAKFLEEMEKSEGGKERVRQYKETLAHIMNTVKGFAQRLALQMKAQAKRGGNGGMDPKEQAKLAGQLMVYRAKASNLRESHAMRTAQKQTSFELEQRRKDRELEAELRREAMRTQQELAGNMSDAIEV